MFSHLILIVDSRFSFYCSSPNHLFPLGIDQYSGIETNPLLLESPSQSAADSYEIPSINLCPKTMTKGN